MRVMPREVRARRGGAGLPESGSATTQGWDEQRVLPGSGSERREVEVGCAGPLSKLGRKGEMRRANGAEKIRGAKTNFI
jgi:hypothetical protein